MSGAPRKLTIADLSAEADRFDACVAKTPGIDLYCSSTDWILPAHTAFSPGSAPWILSVDDAYSAMMEAFTADGTRVVVAMEPLWGLASSLIGPDPSPVVEALFEQFLRDRRRMDGAFFSGLPVGGAAVRALVREAGSRFAILQGPEAGRHAADLTGGLDGFFARRSAKFRANLRREHRLAARAGVVYERVGGYLTENEAEALYDRILRLELRSWKGLAGQGIDQEPARRFYAAMVSRLAARGTLRAVFARLHDEDIAFVFGGLFAQTYRGLQCSFDDAHRALAPGALVHLEMIAWLCEAGLTLYDLGSDMEYKRRWGEPGLVTATYVALRRP